MGSLIIRGARQHNLKGFDLTLPRNQLVVITGPSGSGKSSLAFDTIYAEGQRRYVESLSAYARQFLEQLPKPAVESIDGLSPAIAIEQRSLARNPRSTVGTVTEVADYLRLLFARIGVPHCPDCGKRIEAQTVQQIVDRILALAEGTRASLLAPICRGRRGELRMEIDQLRRDGFVRVRIDGNVVDLGDDVVLDRSRPHDLDVVVDRVVVREGAQSRIADSVELALKHGRGDLLLDLGAGNPNGEPTWMSERFACVECGISLPRIEPRMFSFNSPHGACPDCSGLGVRMRIDPARVVPDESRTLRQGAVAAWGPRGSVSLSTETDRAVQALRVDPDIPWSELPESMQQLLLFGPRTVAGGKPRRAEAARSRRRVKRDYEGIVPRLERLLEGEAQEDDDGDDEPDDSSHDGGPGRYAVSVPCESCGGVRLRREALAVKLGGRSIAELGRLPLDQARDELAALLAAAQGRSPASAHQRPKGRRKGTRSGKEADAGTPRAAPEGGRPLDANGGGGDAEGPSRLERAVAEPLLRAVVSRLGFLLDVGLDYLSLDRPAHTLSGGEGQRIRLATQIGAALVGVLYVLDEPSVGLHARDKGRLLEALRRLVALDNSVIVVEHDLDTILAADYVVDIGPGAGVHGGNVVAQGTAEHLARDPNSVTGPYLTGARALSPPARVKRPGREALVVRGARANNLKELTVRFPLGLLIAVAGVSGSGKSTLVVETLLAAARAALYRSTGPVGACDEVAGLELIDKVIAIDQAPIGRTPRSNPATYTGMFAALRELFAGVPEARARGYRTGRFSFNVKGGRCETCQGDGLRRVQMHFLPDVFVTCDACGGQRYNRETLEIRYHGLSIADALALTVDEARLLFESIPRLRDRLDALSRVGLGYVTLGQPATTLSGGEAQRVKLARELAKQATGQTLYVLDEPTTGLHPSDVELLMASLIALRDAGNTVVVIEHDIDLIACCDWVLDLGPEGGNRGGRLVAEGSPAQVASTPGSITGTFLAARLHTLSARSAPRPSRARRAPKAPRTAAAKGSAKPTATATARGGRTAESPARTRRSSAASRRKH